MHPLLFEIPLFSGIRVYTYGVLVALGFVVGITWTVREGKKIGIAPDIVMDLAFYIILATLVGARLLYIIVEWHRYALDILGIFRIWEGGLVFYGGLISSILVSIFYLKKHRLPFFKVADLFMPGVALGHAIGRLGCLAAGCCYGRPADGFFAALTFPATEYSLAPAGIPLFPSQLMEMAAELGIFLILTLASRRKKFDGAVFLLYIVLYSVARSILETFRGDVVRGFVIPGWLSTSQFVSIIMFLVATALYCYLRPHNGDAQKRSS